MLACSLVRSALASASVRPISASVLAIAGRRKVTNSAVFTSPLSVLASSRTVHCILPALVVRHQSGRSTLARQATRPRFLPLPTAPEVRPHHLTPNGAGVSAAAPLIRATPPPTPEFATCVDAPLGAREIFR